MDQVANDLSNKWSTNSKRTCEVRPVEIGTPIQSHEAADLPIRDMG